MIWKAIHWSIDLLFWIALVLFLVSAFHNRGPATVRAGGKVEFAPRWFGILAWMYVAVRISFIAFGYLRHGLGEPLTFATGAMLGLSIVASTFVLPGTVVSTDAGIEEVFWLWRNKKNPMGRDC